jgi:hypothetical protein
MVNKLQGHVVLVNRVTIVTQRVRLDTPYAEPRSLIKPSSLNRRRADTEVYARHARQSPRVVQNRAKNLRSEALAAMPRRDVHAPEMRFVRGFQMPVAVHAGGTGQVWGKGTEND